MLPIDPAMTWHADDVAIGAPNHVAAALRKQTSHDVAPIWSVNASISAFAPDPSGSRTVPGQSPRRGRDRFDNARVNPIDAAGPEGAAATRRTPNVHTI